MEFNTLRYEKDKEQPQIVYITLNRPEKSNAISIGRGNMTQEIKDAMEMVSEDADVKVAVFRAAGKDFSAGYDLEQVYRVYGGTPTKRPYQRTRLMIDDPKLESSGTDFDQDTMTIMGIEFAKYPIIEYDSDRILAVWF